MRRRMIRKSRCSEQGLWGSGWLTPLIRGGRLCLGMSWEIPRVTRCLIRFLHLKFHLICFHHRRDVEILTMVGRMKEGADVFLNRALSGDLGRRWVPMHCGLSYCLIWIMGAQSVCLTHKTPAPWRFHMRPTCATSELYDFFSCEPPLQIYISIIAINWVMPS